MHVKMMKKNLVLKWD